MGRFATGVAIVTGRLPDGTPAGLTVNSFTALSLDPPLVLFCPARAIACLDAFTGGEGFVVNFLAEDQRDLSILFASPTNEKFSNLDYQVDANGLPILEGCLAAVQCRREAVHDGGDHFIVVGRVQALHAGADKLPLLYFKSDYQRIDAP